MDQMPYLFSYGTLQQDDVQRSTFGRRLHGTPDELVGFIVVEVRIENNDVIARSGKAFHPLARSTGSMKHRVPGTVYEVTEAELEHSDQYEVDAYQRVTTRLKSGKIAWVYVEAA